MLSEHLPHESSTGDRGTPFGYRGPSTPRPPPQNTRRKAARRLRSGWPSLFGLCTITKLDDAAKSDPVNPCHWPLVPSL